MTQQKKTNYLISIRLAKIGAESIPKHQMLQVVWKRGPEKQTSGKFDLNMAPADQDDKSVETLLDETMSKVSGFYIKNGKFEKKDCNFAII